MGEYYNWRSGNICYSKAAGDRIYMVKRPLVTSYECLDLQNGENKSISTSVIRGVPLTEDRLLKLHFTRIDKCYVYNGCWVRPLHGICYLEFGNLLTDVKSVHELQNAYFKKAGEELPLPFLEYNVY